MKELRWAMFGFGVMFGGLLATLLVAIRQDSFGLDGYIAHLRGHWVEPGSFAGVVLYVSLALLIVTMPVVAYLLNRIETAGAATSGVRQPTDGATYRTPGLKDAE